MASAAITNGASNRLLSAKRKAVCWTSDFSPISGISCFGYSWRESGQSRLPAPPARMTGMTGTLDSAKPELKSAKAPPRRTPTGPVHRAFGRDGCGVHDRLRAGIRTRSEEGRRACERRQCDEWGSAVESASLHQEAI